MFVMETKKIFCGQSSFVFTSNLTMGTLCGIIAIACISFAIAADPWDWARFEENYLDNEFGEIILEICNYEPAIIFYFIGAIFLSSTILSVKTLVNILKKPTLEIDADCIKVTNLNNGEVHTIKFQDIDRIELSECKLPFKRIPCINIIPVEASVNNMLGYMKWATRKRVSTLYKKTGAVEQIYEHLLDCTIAAAYDAIMESLNKYRESLKQ